MSASAAAARPSSTAANADDGDDSEAEGASAPAFHPTPTCTLCLARASASLASSSRAGAALGSPLVAGAAFECGDCLQLRLWNPSAVAATTEATTATATATTATTTTTGGEDAVSRDVPTTVALVRRFKHQSDVRARLAAARRALDEAERLATRMREALAGRAARLQEAKAKLASQRETVRAYVAPAREALARAAETLEESVAEERRRRIAQLTALFPVEDGVVADAALPAAHSLVAAAAQEAVAANAQSSATTNNTERAPARVAMSMPTVVHAHAHALAVVVRLLVTTSHFLNLALPHPLRMRLGVAYVGPEALGNGRAAKHALALDASRVPLPDYREALRLLQANVSFLCLSQGIPQSALSDNLLDNMWQLLQSPSLGRPVRTCLEESRRREARRGRESVRAAMFSPTGAAALSGGAWPAPAGMAESAMMAQSTWFEPDGFVVVRR